MPVPFSFSVGDFLAVTELTGKVVQAWRESVGSAPGVRSFLETLTAFQRAISTCQALAVEWTTAGWGNHHSREVSGKWRQSPVAALP